MRNNRRKSISDAAIDVVGCLIEAIIDLVDIIID